MFTPAETSIGAIFLQYATASYMKVEGKALTFASVLYTSLVKPAIDNLSILAGTVASAFFVKKYLKDFVPEYITSSVKSVAALGSIGNYVTSGFLVGFGSSLGQGCSSSHVVGGLGRLRLKSFVSSLVFLTTGAITSAVLDNSVSCGGEGCSAYDSSLPIYNANKTTLLTLLGVGLVHVIAQPFIVKKVKETGNDTYIKVAQGVTGLTSGFLYGLGLLVSGLASPAKVLDFLSITSKDNFDPSLALIPVFAVLPNALYWSFTLPKDESDTSKTPILEDKYELDFDDSITLPYVLGNAVYGVGWGLAGLSPSTGFLGAVFNGSNGLYWLGSFLAGYFVATKVDKAKSEKA